MDGSRTCGNKEDVIHHSFTCGEVLSINRRVSTKSFDIVLTFAYRLLSMARPQRKCPHCNGSGTVDDPYLIGLEMRKLRDACGLSVREVARRIKKSAMYVSHLERGLRNWSEEMIAKYRKALK